MKPLPAGPATAAVLELACGLSELTASLAGEGELISRARELRSEAEALGRQDADAYAERLRTGWSEAREETIEVPLRMAELAVRVAALAAEAADRGKRDSRYDAVAGALLAEAAARVAALLVEVNAGRSDLRTTRAREVMEAAGVVARGALDG